MAAKNIVARLQGAKDELHRHHVHELWPFGSVLRGDLHANSDIDVLVDFDAPVSLLDLVRLRWYLESLLNRSVDVGTRDALKPRVRDKVLREAIRAV